VQLNDSPRNPDGFPVQEARMIGYDTHPVFFRLEMKYLPSVEKIVAAAKRTLAAS
jgi:hypothetical protein